jgi:dihydrofolate reductase
MTEPVIAFVVAASENNVIGRDGKLPWRLKSELRLFRRITMGKPVLMGRKTFQSLPRALDGRDNIVVSRSGFAAPGAHMFTEIDSALAFAADRAKARGASEVCVIGGAEIFAAALARATRIYLTRVHAEVDGDVHLAPFSAAEWRTVSTAHHAPGPGDDHAYTLNILERVGLFTNA